MHIKQDQVAKRTKKKLDMVAVASHDVGSSLPPAHVLIN